MEVPFDAKIKRLDEWFDYNEWLMLKNEDYGRAEIWKRQVYNIQHDAARALSEAHYSLTPCDTNDNEIIRNDDQIVIDPKVIESAFYLRYCILLLQCCGDKLAQRVRCCALGITQGLKEKDGEATEYNTTLKKLPVRLGQLIKCPTLPDREKVRYQKIREELEKYLTDGSVSSILEYANAIKHRWQLFYQGEGLQPLKPEIIVTKNKAGKIIRREFPTVISVLGEDINKHICLCLETNNMFVDIANAIYHHLDPNRFYTDKNGTKILEIGVEKG